MRLGFLERQFEGRLTLRCVSEGGCWRAGGGEESSVPRLNVDASAFDARRSSLLE